LSNEYVAPRSDLEGRLAKVWSEILEIDAVGVADSFFDLGGDSLRAAEVVRRAREKCGVAIALAALFEHATIGALAEHLERGEAPRPVRT
jgi:acyl carrier protein